MAFMSGKKGTKRIPRDPRNRHNYHPNPGGGGDPPSYPSPPLKAPGARGGNTDRGVLSAAATSLVAGGGDVGPGGGDNDKYLTPLHCIHRDLRYIMMMWMYSSSNWSGGVQEMECICTQEQTRDVAMVVVAGLHREGNGGGGGGGVCGNAWARPGDVLDVLATRMDPPGRDCESTDHLHRPYRTRGCMSDQIGTRCI
jgi:hypothetical protein